MNKTIALLALVLAVMITPTVLADQWSAGRTKADAYMAEDNFKKAFKEYRNLARNGDHDSQYLISEMYLTGTGTKKDAYEAYGWSVVATESKNEDVKAFSDAILADLDDKTKANRRGMKLTDKYGDVALTARAEQVARRTNGQQAGSCTGSRLRCGRVTAVSMSPTQDAGAPPVASGGN